MKDSVIAACLYLLMITLPGSPAYAQIIIKDNIGHICKDAPQATHRRTLVYVDLSSISKAKKEWGLTILNRLELAPREFLTILSVNPNTFEINQVFESCYPTMTKPELEGRRDQQGIWDRMTNLDPADQQKENLKTFDVQIRSALDKLLADASTYEAGKRRNILGAIAFDKNRYSDRSALYRVLIYTNGNIVDPDIDAGAEVARQLALLTTKYPASFYGAEVTLFGINEGNEGALSLQSREQLFSAFFLNSWAQLKSFSSSLPQQRNDLFPGVSRLDGTFEGGGAQGGVRLAYTVSNGGNLSEGWLAFTVSRIQLFVPFEGNLQCDGGQCKLSATCTETVPLLSNAPYFRKGDKLLLQSNSNANFEGTLLSETREVFKDGNQEMKYVLKFPK